MPADNTLLIIPDVHGRKFRKEAVAKYPDLPTVFLGDYHDPYPYERISREYSLANFKEILEYARSHDNVTLLLGNHDLQYIIDPLSSCRFDLHNFGILRELFLNNLDLFRLAALRQMGDKTVLFSHAPVLPGWLDDVGISGSLEEIVAALNQLVAQLNVGLDFRDDAERKLWRMSRYRGGRCKYGSPIWADDCEIEGNLLPCVDYEIFGHTQQDTEAKITDHWANLDVRRAFLLSADLKLRKI